MTKRLICGHQFVLVATLEPERDARGRIVEFNPKGPDGRELSDAPFCRFSFPTHYSRSGVYAVVVADRVVYVGKTNDLSRRWGSGEYGEISAPKPGNPEVTNRRVNHGILDASRRGETVQVWFHQTRSRDSVETLIIGRLDLPWNREGLGPSAGPPELSEPGRRTWPSAIRAAESAKAVLIQNPALGERLFLEILQDHPNDGMVYMNRAEAWEAVGDCAAASADFARAEALVPFPGRKAQARAGLLRTRGAG